VTGVEMFKKLLDEGRAGDNVGLLLRGVDKDDVERGQVIAKPGNDHAAHEVKGSVYVLARKREGGTRRSSRDTGRSSTSARRRDGVAELPEGTEMVMPGDKRRLDGGTDHPGGHGQRLALRDSRRRPDRGAGTVTEIIQ